MTADAVTLGGSALRRFGAPRPAGATWLVLWVLVVAGTLGTLGPVVVGRVEVTPVEVVFRLVGVSFAVCGLLAWRRRPDSRVGVLMLLAGLAFSLSPLLEQVPSPVATTLALWVPDLWILPFVWLLLTLLTGGRLRWAADRLIVGTVAIELAVLAPLYLAVSPQDPGNLLLVADAPAAAAVVDTVQKVVLAAVTVATVAVVVRRVRAATPAARRALLPSLAGCLCLVLFAVVLVVDLAGGGRSPVLLWAAACAIAAVPVAFLVGLLRSRLARGALADLFRDLAGMPPGELRTALARALGDPDLVLAYPGEGTTPVGGPGRSVTAVTRGGVQVAVLVHDAALDDDPELVEAVAGAAALARENRLLQEARGRVITAADAERRRIERNLHDGAQQRLVLLGLQLSALRRRIREDPADAELLVASASDELSRSLTELRELASGIHPAVLDRGLRPALESLVLRSAVPTSLDVQPGAVPEPVAFAAYLVASEALTNIAKYARASAAGVRVTQEGGALRIEVADDGCGGADPARGTGLRGLADRAEALGGTLQVTERPGGGTLVLAVLPLLVQELRSGGPPP